MERERKKVKRKRKNVIQPKYKNDEISKDNTPELPILKKDRIYGGKNLGMHVLPKGREWPLGG